MRAKRIMCIILALSALHFAVMFVTTMKMVEHNLSRSFTLFGRPPADTPDTWCTRAVAATSNVLRQPVDLLLENLPPIPPEEQTEETLTDVVIVWLIYALNSIVWGTVICSLGYVTRRQMRRRITP